MNQLMKGFHIHKYRHGFQTKGLFSGQISSVLKKRIWTWIYPKQGFGSILIFSGSGSIVWGWRSIRIRIQSGSRALMTKNWKILQLKKKLNFFWSKTTIYLSLGLHKVCPSYRRSRSSQKRPSNTSKHDFFYLCGSFLPSWIRIHWPDGIRIQSGSGSETLIQSPTRSGSIPMRNVVCISTHHCCGSGTFIRDPNFFPSRIPDPHQRI